MQPMKQGKPSTKGDPSLAKLALRPSIDPSHARMLQPFPTTGLASHMRKLCPNVDNEDGLDTVFEVPIPEEMFAEAIAGCGGGGGNNNQAKWQNMRKWLRKQPFDKATDQPSAVSKNAELQLLLNVVGCPLIPCPVPFDRAFTARSVRDTSIQASTAKYILTQYIAATGGQAALTSVQSFYAVGKVRMSASEFHMGDQSVLTKGQGEIGGFVLWQKHPDLWHFELIMAGCKMSAGSNGKVAWRQSASEQSHTSRGPPRPLRRSLQGLDPRSTASLFSDAVCIGETVIDGEECFKLKLEANPATLKARSAPNFDIIHHTIWGYFSQRTGLLIQLEDSHLLRMKAGRRGESIFWETSMESVIQDYRYINGINIAHAGKSNVTLFRYGEGSINHKRKMEETWSITEADFNLRGLTMDCFLPPSDMKKED